LIKFLYYIILYCYIQTPKFFCKVEGLKRGMERRIQKLCLAGTEAGAVSWTHFYDSKIWVNVSKERYNAFSKSSNRWS